MDSQSSDSNSMVHFGTWEQRAPTSPTQPDLSTQAGVESVQNRIHRAADGTGRGLLSALVTTTGAGATSVTAGGSTSVFQETLLSGLQPLSLASSLRLAIADTSGITVFYAAVLNAPHCGGSAAVRQPSGCATPVPTSSMPPWAWAGSPATLVADMGAVTPTPVRTRTDTPSYPDFTIGDAMIPARDGFNGVLTYPSGRTEWERLCQLSNATTLTGTGTVDAPANVPSSVNQVTSGQSFWYPMSGTQPAVIGTFWTRVWNCAVVSAPYIGWGGWYSRRCYSEWWSSCRCGEDDRRIGTKCWICSAYEADIS
ncbi:hypothetical protein GN958_ATG08192 [Phytophthora infestans]|uniref:Uncharacterized protein n=1 Tax=Phytophthora infestans TaxID=4787 RepID=A0A8S9UP27_PHYIN|nr:hypothetical protein GN958_ATG08192 [Phytophthora infestans]